jgi:hypothetical protein
MTLVLLQDDVERQELRVEMALAEIGAHRQQDQRRSAAADAAAGIDAFEMTLKRLGTAGGSGAAGRRAATYSRTTRRPCVMHVHVATHDKQLPFI